jgi:hypothetical protein
MLISSVISYDMEVDEIVFDDSNNNTYGNKIIRNVYILFMILLGVFFNS